MLLADNENTCAWCGHGDATPVTELAYRRNMELLSSPPTRGDLLQFPRKLTEEQCVTAARAWERSHGELPSSREWQERLRPGETRPSYATVRRLFGGWQGFMNAIADVPREALVA